MAERDPRERTRRLDKLMPLLIPIAAIVILVVGVMSGIAMLSVNKAESAASTAQDAAESAEKAVKTAAKNSATIDDLCLVVRNQREALSQSVDDTKKYLASPVADQVPAFSAYIEQVSLPEAISRVKSYDRPEHCARMP